jgi:hypothetical protein
MESTARLLYREREKRITDCIQLKIPDRVPVSLSLGYFPAKYVGIKCTDAFYNYDSWLSAYSRTVLDFGPDVVHIQPFFPGRVLEYLGPAEIKWPGHGVSPDHGHQSIDGEWMKGDEYDAFLNDMSDFMLRVYIPRRYKMLKAFEHLPALTSAMFGYRAVSVPMAMPEIIVALETFLKAAQEFSGWESKMEGAGLATFGEEIIKLGFPLLTMSHAPAPFDIIPDHLRGLRGAMLDLYRRPDKVILACEKLLPIVLEKTVRAAKRSGNPRIFTVLHNGSDSFMSMKQFDTFYWPTYKRLIFSLINEGLTPCVFFNGDCTSRLEHLLELPRGKVLIHFESSDIFRAREILQNHMCIEGNVHTSLLQSGTVQEVIDYCKKLIDIVGKDGGLIMSTSSPVDDVNPANLKALCDFTRDYGKYR